MNEIPSPPFNPFLSLQSNATALFDQIFLKHQSKMNCASGCSQCCHAEFSIFIGEAVLIYEWFQKMDSKLRDVLMKKWDEFSHQKSGICAFLVQGKCSVYEARPIICRTQGAPLSFTQIEETIPPPKGKSKGSEKVFSKSSKGKKSDDEVRVVDCCPLNFSAGAEIPKSNSDWFELDRLTSLQSIAQVYADQHIEFHDGLKQIVNSEGRIPLRELQNFLRALENSK
jgi:hypothetical protein